MTYTQIRVLFIYVLLIFSSLSAVDVVVTVTETPIATNCERFGINIIRILDSHQTPIQMNFEGREHRVCLKGELFSNGFMAYSFMKRWDDKTKVSESWVGADIRVLCGAAKGEKRIITKVTFKNDYGYSYNVKKNIKTDYAFLHFDTPLTGLNESERVDLGSITDQSDGDIRKAWEGDVLKNVGILLHKDFPTGSLIDRQLGFFAPKNYEGLTVIRGDVPEGVYGESALQVQAGAGCEFHLGHQAFADINGTYMVLFWAKGGGAVTLSWHKKGGSTTIQTGAEWKQYTCEVPLKVAEGNRSVLKRLPAARMVLTVQGKTVLFDDVVIKKPAAQNPTDFDDNFVQTLRDAKVGCVRMIQEGGDGVDNVIQERLRQHQFDGTVSTAKGEATSKASWFMKHRTFTMPEHYRLCEHLGTNPWYNVPGTLYPEDMYMYMEYIGAPADVGMGQLRAEQGHPIPWSQTFEKIYIEFGNEIWNTAGDYPYSSYDGRAYWDDLITRAKQSKWYTANMIFIAGTDSKTQTVQEADLYMTRAPYITHEVSEKLVKELVTKKDLYRWVFATGQANNWFGRSVNALAKYTKNNGKGMAVYETHYHMDKPKGTEHIRKDFCHSQAAGVNIMNTMLGQMQYFNVTPQCLFDYASSFFKAGIFGAVVSHRIGYERYRPSWLGLKLCNHHILPTMTAVEIQNNNNVLARQGVKVHTLKQAMIEDIYAYAFTEGTTRTLILVNMNLDTTHMVRLNLPGIVPASAQVMVLGGGNYDSNNEEGHKPMVELTNDRADNFSANYRLSVAPATMIGIKWEIE